MRLILQDGFWDVHKPFIIIIIIDKELASVDTVTNNGII